MGTTVDHPDPAANVGNCSSARGLHCSIDAAASCVAASRYSNNSFDLTVYVVFSCASKCRCRLYRSNVSFLMCTVGRAGIKSCLRSLMFLWEDSIKLQLRN